ncbi:MAG: Fic family protein [Candidatus Dependentiae bacterium]|nr:Fic family protein [Candidatus Dependentiae bacterium]
MFDISTITITPEMLQLISEIDEFKGAWQLLGRLAPDRLQALRKVATIESIGSSTRIEGVKLSDRDVEKLLSNLETYSFVSRDEQEVAGYAYLCQEIFQGYESMTVSENLIKQLHAMLLRFSEKDERHRGEYKKLSNSVEAFDVTGKSIGIIFQTASPFETPMRMQELMQWVNQQNNTKQLHPLLVIAVFIVVFLAIHPFQDGNGRLSRILTTLLLLQAGYLYVPYSALESFIERSKESYYLALRKTQASLHSGIPNFTPWLIFFLKMLQKQKLHLEQKILKEKTVAMNLPMLSSQILTLLHEHGSLNISDLQQMTQTNRNTLKKHLANLVTDGMIVRLGQGKASFYTLP